MNSLVPYSIFTLWLASTGVLAWFFWIAPEGYEDGRGFHLGRPE